MPDSAAAGHRPQTLKSSAALLEGREGEEDVGEPPRVLLELRALGRRVAVAEDQEVHLRGGIAVLLDREERRRATGGGRVDEHVRRDRRASDQTSRNALLRVPLLQHDLDRSPRAPGSAATRGRCGASPSLRPSSPTRRRSRRSRASRARGSWPGPRPRRSTCRGWCRRSAGPGCPATAAARRRRGRG